MSMVLINDTPFPEDVEILAVHWGLKPLDGAEGTGRSETTGIIFIDRIAYVRTLIVDIGPTSVADMSFILKLIKPEIVNVVYIDAEDGAWRRDDFYVADRGAQVMVCDKKLTPFDNECLKDVMWAGTSFEFTGAGNPVGGS